MRIFLKDGIMIKVKGTDHRNNVSFTEEGCIFLTGTDAVRAVFPRESVNFIDFENDEETELVMEIFPLIK